MERDGRSHCNHRVRLVAKQKSENSIVLSTDLMTRGAARVRSGDGGGNRGSRGGNNHHQSQNQGGGGGGGTTRALRPSQQGQTQGVTLRPALLPGALRPSLRPSHQGQNQGGGGGGGGGGGVGRGPSQIGGQLHNKQVKVYTQSKVTTVTHHVTTKQKKCVISRVTNQNAK